MFLGSDYLCFLFEEDFECGVYCCKWEMFIDLCLFELEMKYIFEGNWVYFVYESQVVGVNDYLIIQIGCQLIVIVCNCDGQFNVFINVCSYCGVMFCWYKSGNCSSYICLFYGWIFNNFGKLFKVKDLVEVGYLQGFNCEGLYDLIWVVCFEFYCGFLFGSFNFDVRLLVEYLGELVKIIDMIVDQLLEGFEVLCGFFSYVYEGNWKFIVENGVDGYYVSLVYWNYVVIQSQCQQCDVVDQLWIMSVVGWVWQGGGFYLFEYGYMLFWSCWVNFEDWLVFECCVEFVCDFGEVCVDWMIENLCNFCLYFNVYLMDQFSLQICIVWLLLVDCMEIIIYCIVLKGESVEVCVWCICQYEDFFNVSGMVILDDLEEFCFCQQGYQGSVVGWNDLLCGVEYWIEGVDVVVVVIDLWLCLSGVCIEDEGLFVLQYCYWQEVLFVVLECEWMQCVVLWEVVL